MTKKIFFIALITIMFMAQVVNAGSITVSSNKTSLEVGQTATITITGVNATGQVNITSSNTSVATVSQSTGWVENNSITVTVTAKAAGSAQITVKPDPNGEVVDSTTAEAITGSKSVSITVTAPVVPEPEPTPKPEPEPEPTPEPTPTPDPKPETPAEPTKSNNANLSNLGIRPNDFTGFKAGTTSYSVSVPYEVGQIEVYASKGHVAQTISGTGTKFLSEGSNTFSVEVTAEDGTKKTYKITVVRLVKEEQTNPVVEEPQEVEVALSSLEIENVTLNEAFNPETLEYTGIANENAEKVIVKATANVENAKVEVTGAEEYEEGENTIRVTVKSEDGKNSRTYVIKVTKAEQAVASTDDENKLPAVAGVTTNNDQGGNGGIGMEKLLFCIGIGVVAILGIIFAVIRYRKDKEDEMVGEVSFTNGFSTKEAIKDAVTATSKLSNTGLEEIGETGEIRKNRGRHF